MLDVDAQRLGPTGGPVYRRGDAQSVDQRRTGLIVGAFAVAIVLGVVIGLVTAPRARTVPLVAPATAAPPSELQPALDPPTWEGSRLPGTAHQMRVREQDRRAFSASLAYDLRENGAGNVTTADVVIPPGKLFYGALEGRDSTFDEYWAVGLAQVAGVASAPPNPHVWKRTGGGPWMQLVEGPGACDRLPPVLFTAWRGRPGLCSGA
ncbi:MULTISPECIES: hypothetical protein [unclassified Frankia]|uniref:hypothetical protein n=1 Tax=unclassified Frankia TaxID=2632575 RepID=UPI001EF58B88|nr:MULTISPECIES: hypothetical protein [unclassified Frankia]